MKLKILLGSILTLSLLAIASMTLLSMSITSKKIEQAQILAPKGIVPDADKYKSESWANLYPDEYDSWKRTRMSSDIIDLIDEKPQLAILWAGYGFAKDYNAPRGHAYAIQDNINSLRTGAPVDSETGPMPTACWTCKATDVSRLIEERGELEFFTGKWASYGAEIVNSIGCADCHDNKNGALKVARPHLDRALVAAGMETFENSSHQEKKSLVCAQCHAEYYFKPVLYKNDMGEEAKAIVVTLPWGQGLTAENMENYYDEMGFADWTHKISKTKMLKAQHPGFELASTGIHAQNNISCVDCHMPYTQLGAKKFTDHQIQNPMDTMDRSCLTCHRESEAQLTAIVAQKYDRKEFLNQIAMDNLAKAHLETGRAIELGATEKELEPIRKDIRSAQWRWDYSIASHGSFFHAPEETLRLLASANEIAQQARLKLVRVLAKHGDLNYYAPDFSNKDAAQKLAGLELQQLIDAKLEFKATLEKAWQEEAIAQGKINPASLEGIDGKASYSIPEA